MKIFRSFICLLLGLSIFSTQNLQASISSKAKINEIKLISTMDTVNAFDRKVLENNIQELTSKKEVSHKLQELGLEPLEIKNRIASLSDKELGELNQSIKEAQAGGILVAAVLVLLIIYLAQRI